MFIFGKLRCQTLSYREGTFVPLFLVYEEEEEEENRGRLGIAGGKVNYGVWREGEGADRHCLLMPNE